MSDAGVVNRGGKGRKVLLQLILGGLCGGVGMFAALTFFEGRSGAQVPAAQALALGTALVFGLMGLIVAFGAMAPGIGARTLNVEDRDELEEQRSTLLISSVTFLLVAVIVGVLAAVSDGGSADLVDPIAAAWITGLATFVLVAWSIIYRNRGDEMMRAAAKEAGAITTNLIFLVFGTWAGAAHLGLVAMFRPLTFIAGFFALYLLAVFIAIGRRGLLSPR